MCANNQTLSAVTGIRTDRDADALNEYQRLVTRATRPTIYRTDQEAEDAVERARKFAHIESHRGNYAPIIDQLERALTD
jgi:hypothetical protein